MAGAVVQEYTTSLEDLTFNSKPHINALTMLAEEYLPHAELIVRVIEAKLHKATSSGKLPVMYLMDSIVKNVGGNYTPLFAKNIVKTFYSTFEKGDEKIKMSLYKLRSTWDSYFPLKRLYDVDAAIHAVDQNWPIKPLPASLQEKSSTSIHVNPRFIKKAEHPTTSVSGISTSMSGLKASAAVSDNIDLKQDLINKQKQLLELQQQKLLLELEQTKQQLAMREKRNQVKRQAVHPLKDPRTKGVTAAAAQSSFRVTLSNGQRRPLKDPRSAAPRVKPNMPTQVKGAPDPRVKLEESKKVVSEKAKPALKKLPPDSPKQAKKKKVSPTSCGKPAMKPQRTISPKISPKFDSSKKAKVLKKKTEGKAIKILSDEKTRTEVPESGKSDNRNQQKPLPKITPKKRDRPERRSLARDRQPPAKQLRRSTSIERQRSKSPPRRVSEPHRRPFPKPLREEELRRDSPRSNEGSVSPRFSPEPDEGPHPGARQNWRPPVKRMRQQGPPEPWRPAEHIQDRSMPIGRRRSSVDPNLTIPQELTLSHQAEILKQAEIQLQSGHLTHTQHQELLKQLHQLFELQRLRNFLQRGGLSGPSEDGDRPRMPLDDLLPEHRGPDPTRHETIRRNDENRPLHFRPPPSPPQMEVGRDGGFRHPPIPRHLTPPPMPPSMDPRSNMNIPPPHPEDSRFWHGRDDFPRHPHDPGFGVNRGVPPHRGMGRGIQRTERRPSPERRRGNDNWEHPPPPRRSDFGEDLGNIFVMDEEERFQHPPRHDFGPNNESPELQNGSKPLPGRVPLRAYAHPEAVNERKPEGMKRRGSFENRGRPKHSLPRKKELEKRKSPTLRKKSPSKEQREKEDEGPHLEEPEDYIIANIPPGAEAYHEHSMKLNAHKKNIMASRYSKKLAESSKEDDTKPSKKGTASANLPEEPIYSPDISRRDKLEEEVNKSPSLPLKKRRYLMSSSSEINHSGGAVPPTESESELLDPPIAKPTASMEEKGDEKKEVLKKEDSGNVVPPTEPESGLLDPHSGGAVPPTESESELLDPPIAKPTSSMDEKKEVLQEDAGDVVHATEPKSELLHPHLKEPSVSMEDKGDEKKEVFSKEEHKNLDKVATEEVNAPALQEEVVKQKVELKITEKKETHTEEEIRKGKDSSDSRSAEKTVAVKKEPAENLKDNKRLGMKKNKKRKKDKNGRLQRIQQLAEDAEKNVQDQGPRGKQFPRSRVDMAKIKEEERLRGLMLEEEERLRWEAELEMQLEREEFQEIQHQRGPPAPPRINRSPPRRGWRRGDDGPWRGPGSPGRGRGWGRGGEFWDDGPPFRGRPRPGRVPQRHRRDEEKWVRLWDGPPPPGPMRGPMPPGRFAERVPPMVSDLAMVGSDGPPRPLPLRGPDQPQSELSQVNVNKLLSDLLNMGIIPGSVKKEVKTTVTPQQNSNETQQTTGTVQSDVTMEPSHSQKELSSLPKVGLSLDNNRVPTPVFEDFLTLDPDAKLPNVTLDDVDKLKVRHEELIRRLYSGIQCSACGMRFTACQTDMYAEHLDWHYRLNRKDKDGVRETHRMLYPTAGEWILYEEIVDPSQRAKNQVFDEAEENEMEVNNDPEDSQDLVVPVALNPEQEKCAVCNEAFKTVYNDEAEEWQYVNCVAVENNNFHPTCYADHNDSKDVTSLPTPERLPLYNPLEMMKHIPGLDSLREDTDIENNPISDKTEDTAINAKVATAGIESEVAEGITQESTEVQQKETGAETSERVVAESQPAVSKEAPEEEESDRRPITEPAVANQRPITEAAVANQRPITEAAVANEQAVVKEERPTTPTDSSFEFAEQVVNGKSKPPENETVQSQDPVQDSVEFKDPVQDAVESQDPVQDSIESKDPVQDAVESLDPVQDAVESPDPVQDSVESKDPVQDSVESKDPVQDAVVSLDPVLGETQSSATQPSTSESPEDELKGNTFQTLVKLERSEECHSVPESVARTEAESRQPFVALCDTGSVTPMEERLAEGKPASPSPSGICPPEDDGTTQTEENFTKAEPTLDSDIGFPISTVITVVKTENDESVMPKFEPTVFVAGADQEGNGDQPPPPGTEPTDDTNFLNEMHDELDYDDSDVNVTI